MLKRHEIQVLRRAGHTLADVATLSGTSIGTVRRVVDEDAVTTVDNDAERDRRHVGRPSKAEAFREVLLAALVDDATLRTVELLHRARGAGYTGGKTALYALAQTLRGRAVTPLVRFEGLAGEFSQHDFGEVVVRYQDDTTDKVHFFASRLKYSRWIDGHAGARRARGNAGPHVGRPSGGLRRHPVGRGLRPPEDGGPEVGPGRRRHGVESDLRRRGARLGARRGGVLAVSAASRRARSRTWSAG